MPEAVEGDALDVGCLPQARKLASADVLHLERVPPPRLLPEEVAPPAARRSQRRGRSCGHVACNGGWTRRPCLGRRRNRPLTIGSTSSCACSGCAWRPRNSKARSRAGSSGPKARSRKQTHCPDFCRLPARASRASAHAASGRPRVTIENVEDGRALLRLRDQRELRLRRYRRRGPGPPSEQHERRSLRCRSAVEFLQHLLDARGLLFVVIGVQHGTGCTQRLRHAVVFWTGRLPYAGRGPSTCQRCLLMSLRCLVPLIARTFLPMTRMKP